MLLLLFLLSFNSCRSFFFSVITVTVAMCCAACLACLVKLFVWGICCRCCFCECCCCFKLMNNGVVDAKITIKWVYMFIQLMMMFLARCLVAADVVFCVVFDSYNKMMMVGVYLFFFHCCLWWFTSNYFTYLCKFFAKKIIS